MYTPDFADGTAYRCRFDALGGPVYVRASYDERHELLSCNTQPSTVNGPLTISISLNDQDYTAYPVQFTVHTPPRLIAFSPTSGPQAGNTTLLLHGAGFDVPPSPSHLPPSSAECMHPAPSIYRCRLRRPIERLLDSSARRRGGGPRP